MNKKPDVFEHMISWGAMSGMILAILYVLFFVLMPPYQQIDLAIISVLMMIETGAMMVGGILGVILGCIEAFGVEFILRDIPQPFTKQDMMNGRWLLYSAVFLIPIAFCFILSFWDNQPPGISVDLVDDGVIVIDFWLVFGIPTLIASIASVYASHRYMFRLHLWSESQYARKSKAKNEETFHLMDKVKSDDTLLAESENVVINNKIYK